jgi:hypothetical protein
LEFSLQFHGIAPAAQFIDRFAPNALEQTPRPCRVANAWLCLAFSALALGMTEE